MPAFRRSTAYLNRFTKLVVDRNYICPKTLRPWRDDSADGKPAVSDEDQEAYNFLHRSPHRHSDLGGYGEDFGFHYVPRVWVDPDSPHITPYFNRWIKCANLREARYSHHRRFLHAVDVEKLIRHGRLLPMPHRLLNDYLMCRIPLTDRDLAAIFRYARSILIRQGSDQYYPHVEEMFERVLATMVPPVEIGAHTHAALIRCCASIGRWKEGYEWFRNRIADYDITENSELYDAILELCETCEEHETAWLEFEKLLKLGVRVPSVTLCRMIRIAAEQRKWELGNEVWDLFEFFDEKRDAPAYASYLTLASECPGHCERALGVFAELRTLNLIPTIEMAHSVMYTLCKTPGYMELARSLMNDLLSTDQQTNRGLLPDYRTVTYMMMGCAVNSDMQLAMEIYNLVLGPDYKVRSIQILPEAVFHMLRAIFRGLIESELQSLDGGLQKALPFTLIREFVDSSIRHVRKVYPRSNYEEWILTEHVAILSQLGDFSRILSILKFFAGSNFEVNMRIYFFLLYSLIEPFRRCSLLKSLEHHYSNHIAPSTLNTNEQNFSKLRSRGKKLSNSDSLKRADAEFELANALHNKIMCVLDMALLKRVPISRCNCISEAYGILRSLYTKECRTAPQQLQPMARSLDATWEGINRLTVDTVPEETAVASDMSHTTTPSNDKSATFDATKDDLFDDPLWGIDPALPLHPRHAKYVKSNFHFSREEKGLQKLGQGYKAPKHIPMDA